MRRSLFLLTLLVLSPATFSHAQVKWVQDTLAKEGYEITYIIINKNAEVVVGGNSGDVHFFDITTGILNKVLLNVATNSVTKLSFSPSEQYLAISSLYLPF